MYKRQILNSNGFPQITSSPIVLGDPNPDWRGGISLSMRYKKFRLNAVLEHSEGGDFSPRTLWVLRRFGTTQETANRITLDQPLVNYRGNTIPAGTTVRGNIKDFGGGPVLLDENCIEQVLEVVLVITKHTTSQLLMLLSQN